MLASQRQQQATQGGDGLFGGPGGPGGGDMGPRPMTSARGAGYSSANKNARSGVFDPLGQASTHGPAPPLEKYNPNNPEYNAKQQERGVNKLLEEAAFAAANKNFALMLERAKAAGDADKRLREFRNSNGLKDQQNVDLTYAVLFMLANAFASSKLYAEALRTYSFVVKDKNYPQAGRLRVNMGNIYAAQKKYPAAIKMYRMAMDQLGNLSREQRFKIMRNIGNAFVRMGQYQDAIHSFEACVDQAPDAQAAFNLLVCYYAVGDKEKMRKGFLALLAVPEYAEQAAEEEREEEEAAQAAEKAKQAIAAAQASGAPLPDKLPHSSIVDELRAERKARRKVTSRYVHLAARLVAPVIERDLAAGFDWVIEQLKAPRQTGNQSGGMGMGGMGVSQMHLATHLKPGFPSIAMELEIAKGIAFLRKRHISEAIDVFKGFERSDHAQGCLDQAATNLAFLYFLEGDLQSSSRYAELAVRADRYNAKALVNKANYLFVRGELDAAKELYLEAIGVEADCVEAIYNLGLANKKLGQLKDALQAFKKLHRILPRDADVVWHMANLHEMLGDKQDAITLFTTLHSRVPSDPKVLARLGTLYSMEGDEREAKTYFAQSFDAYPVSMEVISWLGVWHVKAGQYDRDEYADAVDYFQRAAEIEPHELKWQLMVASCYRRMDKLDKALAIYKRVHRIDPDNIECLRYLCTICHDTNDKDYEEYHALFRKAERAAAAKAAEQAAAQAGGQQGYLRGEVQDHPTGADDDGQPRAPDVSPGNTSRGLPPQNRGPINLADGFRPELAPAQQGPTFSVGQGGGDEWGEGLGDELLP